MGTESEDVWLRVVTQFCWYSVLQMGHLARQTKEDQTREDQREGTQSSGLQRISDYSSST